MIKADCFAFGKDNKGGKCDCLKHLDCNNCNFYGTVSVKKKAQKGE